MSNPKEEKWVDKGIIQNIDDNSLPDLINPDSLFNIDDVLRPTGSFRIDNCNSNDSARNYSIGLGMGTYYHRETN